ncbi:hypothetical protein DFJ73DRAFT_771430 [Zopfochytrium polystomum]|nr:hypothetical protein DFJ73DRAFT_771430 [Zopfochytrium polystomum]
MGNILRSSPGSPSRVLLLVVALFAVFGLSLLLWRQGGRGDNDSHDGPPDERILANDRERFPAIDGFHPDPARRPLADPLGMFVVGNDGGNLTDVVSDNIATWGYWEADISRGVLEVLHEAERHGVKGPLFLDIGANLGMHSIAVLAYGYRVVSIDALTVNAHHFMSTMCRTPKLMERSTFILNRLTNLGDGTVTCDPAEIAKYKADPRPPGHYSLRQWLPIEAPRQLRGRRRSGRSRWTYEGFELDVLRGAVRLFTKRRVHYVLTEVMGNHKKFKRDGRATEANTGFSCSEEGWYGKRWDIPDAASEVVLKGYDLQYLVLAPAESEEGRVGEQVDRR